MDLLVATAGGWIDRRVSSGLKRPLVALGIVEERVRVLRNGGDLALGLTRPTLLAVGNLIGLKRHRMMIEALVGLPGVDLVIVGEGPQRTAIEALARERRVADRVRLRGRLPQDRLPDIYSAADLSLHVSTHEG